MNSEKTAVVEDMEAFSAWLMTMPLIVWASDKACGRDQARQNPKPGGASGADADLLAALKSMA